MTEGLTLTCSPSPDIGLILATRRSVIASLMTQRDAIRMLHDRMRVLLEYVSGVVQGEFPIYSS